MLAGRHDVPYLKVMLKPAHQGLLLPARRPSGVAFAIVVGGGVLVAAMLLAAAVLWIQYGTAVFFEMIASGLAACF
jgi:hypothetical protein